MYEKKQPLTFLSGLKQENNNNSQKPKQTKPKVETRTPRKMSEPVYVNSQATHVDLRTETDKLLLAK